MPLDTLTYRAGDIEAEARAYAARLDVLLVNLNASDAIEDALQAVGNLLGGLGARGFLADLEAHLARLEADLLEDAPRSEYSPGMGGLDPDAVFSTRLSDQIDQARVDDCASWLQDAQEIMGRLQPAEAA